MWKLSLNINELLKHIKDRFSEHYKSSLRILFIFFSLCISITESLFVKTKKTPKHLFSILSLKPIIKFLLLLITICAFNNVNATELYWIGNSGNWSDGTHWSLTSGGSPSNSIPTLNDNIFFDANSFSGGGQTVNVNQEAYCKSMDWTGARSSSTLSGSSKLNIYGSLTLNSSMNITYTGSIYFKSNEPGNTIQTFGKTLSSHITFDGLGGEWILQDNLNLSSSANIYLLAGALNTNNVTVNANTFGSDVSGIRSLTLGSSTINISVAIGWAWYISGSNFGLDAGTSTINLTGENAFFWGGNLTYYNVTFTGKGLVQANNTFNNLTLGTSKETTISDIQTINGIFTCDGTCSVPAILSGGTLSKTSGNVTINYVRLQNVTATGGATFTANNVTDLGGNSGWNLIPPSSQNLYWIGNGGNWTDSNHWSLTSGGTSSACIPSPYDNVYFDANSFSSGSAVNVNQEAYCKSMDWTGARSSSTLSGSSKLNIYGSLTLNSSMNITYTGSIYFKSNEPGNTIQTFGKTLSSHITFDGLGGEWILQDNLNLSSSANIYLLAGALNTNNVTVNANTFGSDVSGIRSLTLGSSTINISVAIGWAWYISGSNFGLDAGTSTINLTGENAFFWGGNLTYYNVTFTGKGLVQANNTFNNLTLGTSKETTISDIQTINGTFTCDGTSGDYASVTGGTISKSSGIVIVNYVNLKNSTATGGASFFAVNSQDLGGNTGWIFQSSSEFIIVTSPNGGENWQVGTQQNITWTSNGVTNVKIEYTTDNGAAWIPIIESTSASSGSYNWTIPNTPSTNCKVRISNVDNSTTNDVSDNAFTISSATPASITVTYPNGGESWRSGSTQNITWTSSGVTNVKIEYTTDNSTSWSTIIESTSASLGSYTWTIPNTLSTQCKVKIIDVSNSSLYDESNSVFTILVSAPVLTVTPSERNVSNVSGTTTFSVSNTGTGTMEWTAESDAAWAVITSGSGGTDDGTISIDYTVNQSSSSRSAAITITSTGIVGSPMAVTINQSGGVTQPTTLTLNYTENYPSYSNSSDYKSTDYRLIGIPGNSTKKINEFITGTQGEDWEVYWDNGNPEDYYVKFDNSDNFLCAPGRAFWLINTGNWTLNNVSVSSSPLDAQNLTTISISSNKFNLITNPFLVNVAWSDIVAYNQGLTKQPTYWTGNVLGLADTIKPFIGYLLDNTNSSLTEIKIPYLPSGLGKRGTNVNSWMINIEFKSGKYIDKTTVLGISPEANQTVDKFDMIKPRIMGEIPHLYFNRPDWDGEHNEWGGDIRNNIMGVESWDFIANIKNKIESNIKFNNIQLVPDEFEVYLVDESTARVQDMRDNPSYSFIPKINKARMYVIIGEKKLVQKEIEKYIPTKFELLNNYPNPFNPATTIAVIIPDKSNIKLDVYNILGQRVATLYNGELEQGIHYFEWNSSSDGELLSSGVYIYRLQAENRINISRKMVLLK